MATLPQLFLLLLMVTSITGHYPLSRRARMTSELELLGCFRDEASCQASACIADCTRLGLIGHCFDIGFLCPESDPYFCQCFFPSQGRTEPPSSSISPSMETTQTSLSTEAATPSLMETTQTSLITEAAMSTTMATTLTSLNTEAVTPPTMETTQTDVNRDDITPPTMEITTQKQPHVNCYGSVPECLQNCPDWCVQNARKTQSFCNAGPVYLFQDCPGSLPTQCICLPIMDAAINA